MVDPSSFTKLVPGFDFLQGLVQNAGSAVPGIGQWVAPTLNPEELEKRIEELRTVQFWLEQNARLLGATIQALEVQRMTLSTLKTMNVQMSDLRDSLMIQMPSLTPAPAPAPEPAGFAAPAAAPKPARVVEPEPEAESEPVPSPVTAEAQKGTPPAGVDPMQWWGALTKQFTELATAALKDGAANAAKNLAGGAPEPAAAPEPRGKPARALARKPAGRAPAKKGGAAPRKRAGPVG